LVWSIVINGVGAIQVQNSLFTMSFFGWPITKKKGLELWRLANIKMYLFQT
jgi:hypothetical protein